MERFYKAKEIAENLALSIKGLEDMIKRGDFPEPDVGGNGMIRRWKESTIKTWQESLGN
ncbi:helix-turn-helix transcriptional regulator [Vibrio harveyi]|uniref:helix-turn-helix transcriptional regulator n=1 Tax=Vibrio harveyi TaxID=669 RepID=UPI00165DD26E|nr:hypothetical protein [Vibrio harveyi]